MSNKTFMATIIILAFLISLLAGMQSIEVVEANPLPPSWMNPKMTVTIQSPQKGTDNALPVFVNFTAQSSWHFSLSDNQTKDWIKTFFYVLDGQDMSSSGTNFTETQMTGTPATDSERHFSGQAYLADLSDGIHSITVYYGVLVNVGSPHEFIVYNASWSATSQFYVITKTPSPTPTLAPTLTLTSSPSLTTSPTAPEFTPIVVLVLVSAVAIGVDALLVRKRQPTERGAVAL
jgi:hypothetical protein